METLGDSGTTQPLQPLPLRFTGTGGEYFGIWIVNLLLTIVTLGIYSAWAKVRRIQYFHRHTEVAGASLDFHGKPLTILIGRFVAIGLFALYSYSLHHPSSLTPVVIGVIALALPALLRNSLRFRLYNTSWRGLRFSFRGSVPDAYRAFLVNLLLTLISLYLMAPYFHHRLKRYQHDNSFLGETRFSFHASLGSFYLLYLGAAVALAVAGTLVGLSAGDTFSILAHTPKGTRPDPHVMLAVFRVIGLIFVVMTLVVGPWFHAKMTNLIWNNTRLGEHRFECRQSVPRLIWIQASNLVALVATLGLFYPWAMVRFARFVVESMTLVPASDLQEFEASRAERVGAIGEETASVFDFDIAL